MKEIIINEENLTNNEITNLVEKKKYIILDKDNNCFLNFNHGTYEFINDYKSKNNKPFYIIKKYIKDYPFFGDNSLYITYYFLEKDNLDKEKVNIKEIINFLKENKYVNPRNQNITEEMIEVSNYLIKEIL